MAMVTATGGRRGRMGSTPARAHLFISGDHQIRPLRLLPPHNAHYNGYILLTVYFGTPSMFITLWFGFDYGTNPPLGTLII
jgi:hypothetical protein